MQSTNKIRNTKIKDKGKNELYTQIKIINLNKRTRKQKPILFFFPSSPSFLHLNFDDAAIDGEDDNGVKNE